MTEKPTTQANFRTLMPYMSALVYSDFDHEKVEKAITDAHAAGHPDVFVVSHSGFLKCSKLRGGRYVRAFVDTIPNVPGLDDLPELRESIDGFLPAGPIPGAFYSAVESLFKEVMAHYGSAVEAMVMILWSQEKGYHIFVPPQTVAGASVDFRWDSVPSDCITVVDIHSHNTMGAFFSGTDDRDDATGVRVSGVIGRLNDAKPANIWRFSYLTTKFKLDIADVFDFDAASVQVDVPADWKEKIKLRQSTYALGTTYAGSYSGTYGLGGASVGRYSQYSKRGRRAANAWEEDYGWGEGAMLDEYWGNFAGGTSLGASGYTLPGDAEDYTKVQAVAHISEALDVLIGDADALGTVVTEAMYLTPTQQDVATILKKSADAFGSAPDGAIVADVIIHLAKLLKDHESCYKAMRGMYEVSPPTFKAELQQTGL